MIKYLRTAGVKVELGDVDKWPVGSVGDKTVWSWATIEISGSAHPTALKRKFNNLEIINLVPDSQALLERYEAKIDRRKAYGRPVRDRETDKLARIRFAHEFLLQVRQALT